MNLFFSIGLVWVILQLISNRIMFARQTTTQIHPLAIFFGLLLEVGFIVALIVYIN